MQPLSPRKRRVYLYSLIALFFLFLPVIVLYAVGYRFQGEFGFVKTGGIFLSVPYPDAVVSINGETIGESGLLKRSFYVSELAPGSYIVQAVREGAHTWHRTLIVESQLVTDAHVLLVPEDPEFVEISAALNTASTTRRVTRVEFEEYLEEFRTPAPTTTPHSLGGTLFLEEGNVYLRWTDTENPPSFFCTAPSKCVKEIRVETSKQRTIAIASFAGGVVYATEEAGIYMTEADVRPTETFAPLYPVRGATFRIIDDSLIVRDGGKLYEIVGL